MNFVESHFEHGSLRSTFCRNKDYLEEDARRITTDLAPRREVFQWPSQQRCIRATRYPQEHRIPADPSLSPRGPCTALFLRGVNGGGGQHINIECVVYKANMGNTSKSSSVRADASQSFACSKVRYLDHSTVRSNN